MSWIYRTDAGTTTGENAGFVDRVKYLANPDFPDGNFYAGGRVGTGFLRQIPLVDALVPTTWALTGGALPPGITLNSATGELSGVPNTVGTYDPEITATNDAGSSMTSPRIVTAGRPRAARRHVAGRCGDPRQHSSSRAYQGRQDQW